MRRRRLSNTNNGRGPLCSRVIILLLAVLSLSCPSSSYLPSSKLGSSSKVRRIIGSRNDGRRILSELAAAPKRLEENVDGILYVNDRVCER